MEVRKEVEEKSAMMRAQKIENTPREVEFNNALGIGPPSASPRVDLAFLEHCEFSNLPWCITYYYLYSFLKCPRDDFCILINSQQILLLLSFYPSHHVCTLTMFGHTQGDLLLCLPQENRP